MGEPRSKMVGDQQHNHTGTCCREHYGGKIREVGPHAERIALQDQHEDQ